MKRDDSQTTVPNPAEYPSECPKCHQGEAFKVHQLINDMQVYHPATEYPWDEGEYTGDGCPDCEWEWAIPDDLENLSGEFNAYLAQVKERLP